MANKSDFNPIEYLVSRKYHMIPGALVESDFKIRYPSAATNAWYKDKEFVDAFRKELSLKAPGEIDELVNAEQEKENTETAARLAREEEERFFNQSSAAVDLDYYCNLPCWRLDECVGLSFGKDPEQVNWDTVRPHKQNSTFARKYERLRDRTRRAE